MEKVTEPITPDDFDSYYNLRWEILRKPWNQPKGTERDNQEQECIHAMVKDKEGNVIAAGRLQLNSPQEGQIRYMAVRASIQSKGLGSKILRYLETKAKEKGCNKVVLQARENAVQFYIRNGYTIKEKSFLLWDQIQHYLMEKFI